MALDRRVRSDKHRDGLDEREADDGERVGPARHRQAVRRERAPLALEDELLAVDEGAVDVEDDEAHR